MRKLRLGEAVVTAVVLAAGSVFAQPPARVQTFPLRDTAGLVAPHVKTEAVKYLGRDAVRITIVGEDRGGLALLPGTDFQDGVIEADIALKATTPPGVPYPGFVGIAFRTRADGSRYELFYLRPGNADAPDQARRKHSVQHVSEPGFGWYRLRREWPSVYESHAELAFETWTSVRIEVAGAWEMTYLGDAGRFPATMELPVTGAWRGGYVELAIPVEWPKDAGQGAPGPVTAYLAGWIEGDSGKGRMCVEGRSDGVWTARRKN